MADKSPADVANAEFKKSQRDKDAKKAMSEYDAEGAAVRAKTERLKALRLARDASAPQPEPKKAKTAKKTASKSKSAKKAPSASLSTFLDGEEKAGRRG